MHTLTKESLENHIKDLEAKCLECFIKHKDSLDWLKENCRTCYIRLTLEDYQREKDVKTPIRRYGE